MAVDKLVDSTQLDSDLTSVANAIRAKSGGSSPLAFPAGFVSEIGNIPSGGGGDYVAADWLDPTKPTGEVHSEANMSSQYATGMISMPGRTGITKISMPNTKWIPSQCFQRCSNLSEIDMPLLVGTGSSAFEYTALEYAVLPKLDTCVTYTFRNITTLKGVDFGADSTGTGGGIQGESFKNDSQLNIMVLRRPTVYSLNATSVFDGTPFAQNGTGGTIYVPESMISNYQSASNWSTILGYANNQIKKIEGTTYETHYVDGTTIPT